MSFTYTAGSIADRDRVRLYLGDTDALAPLFQDAEHDDFLASEGSVNGAVALACETMANISARKVDVVADGSAFRASQQHAHWMKQARKWRARAGGTVMVMPTRVDGFSDDIDSDETNQVRFDPSHGHSNHHHH